MEISDSGKKRKSIGAYFCCCASQPGDEEDDQRKGRMYQVGKSPVLITCPNCRATQDTHVALKATGGTHMTALLFLPLLLCWLPYCTVMFRKARHYCSACGAYIGESP
ncbi:hypothetical protein NQ318_012152 [Aromia moschata]|uniref:LITAF domain-containing protein n=1 Tax=Aromia moschata TaxID=1265417 RepID=A0AAV8YZE2_9CUCU|nr:hypothetical protein NQ318_012152 [Aromia moschata]